MATKKATRAVKAAKAPKVDPGPRFSSFIIRSLTKADRVHLDTIKRGLREATDSGALARMVSSYAFEKSERARLADELFNLQVACIGVARASLHVKQGTETISKGLEDFAELRSKVDPSRYSHYSHAVDPDEEDDY